MSFFRALVRWLFGESKSDFRVPSTMNNAAPRDHFSRFADHFDKSGNYIFKDSRLRRIANVTKSLAANMVTFTAVGSPAVSNASSQLSVSPTTLGDVLVLCLYNNSGSNITGVSGGGVTRWYGNPYLNSGYASIYYGTVTSTGASTITTTNSGSSYTNTTLWCQEFSAGTAGAWALDYGTNGYLSSAAATSGNFPSVRSAFATELYIGMIGSTGGTTTWSGSTSGFSYHAFGTTGYEPYAMAVYSLTASSSAVSSPNFTSVNSVACTSVAQCLIFTPTGSIGPIGNPVVSTTLTPTVQPNRVGNLITLAITGNAAATSVTGGGVTTWSHLGSVANTVGYVDVWYGTSSSTASSTLTVVGPTGTYSATLVQEFTTGSAMVWALDGTAATSTSSSSSGTYPSRTPSGSNELYFGAGAWLQTFPGSIGGAGFLTNYYGGSTGFSYTEGQSSGNNFPMVVTVFNPSASSPTAQAPGWQASGQPTGNTAYDAFISALFTATAAVPYAPTLTSPANAAYTDVSSGVSLTATYNTPVADNQGAYALRIKVSGGSYQYWNVGTSALQSSIVWNSITTAPSASWTVTLPNTAVSNGHVYNWSMASQDAVTSAQGPFATDLTFTAQLGPSVSVSSPTGTVTGTTLPAIVWSGTFPGGASQTAYQVIVESGLYSTSPGSGTQLWTSGVVSSTSTSVVVGTAMPVGTTLRVFVQLTETGGETSSWAFSTFTLTADVPATPTIVATVSTVPTSGIPCVSLAVQAQDNLLTLNQSSLENGNTTGLVATLNNSIAAVTGHAEDGAYSLSMTSTASGRMDSGTTGGTSGVPVVAGQTYTGMASFLAATSGRTCYAIIYWFNAAGGSIGSNSGTGVTDTTSGWTQATVTATAPTGASFAQIISSVQNAGAANEIHYVDEYAIKPGTSTTWTVGGMVGTTTLSILCSDGHLVRGAGWNGVTTIPSGQSVTILDVECAVSTAVTYTATVTSATSLLSAGATSNSVTMTLFQWDICDPNYPSLGTKIDWSGDNRTFDKPEAQGVFNALGRANEITVHGQMLNQVFPLTLQFGGDGDVGWKAFDTLRSTQMPVLLRGDMVGDNYYVNLGPSRPMVLVRTGNRIADPKRTLTITTAPADRP